MDSAQSCEIRLLPELLKQGRHLETEFGRPRRRIRMNYQHIGADIRHHTMPGRLLAHAPMQYPSRTPHVLCVTHQTGDGGSLQQIIYMAR